MFHRLWSIFGNKYLAQSSLKPPPFGKQYSQTFPDTCLIPFGKSRRRALYASRSNGEQLELRIDRWALTVRVTLVEGWSKGEAGEAAGCVCLSVGKLSERTAHHRRAHISLRRIPEER